MTILGLLMSNDEPSPHVVDTTSLQFSLTHDCIRACIYSQYIQKFCKDRAAWISLGDMCFSEAIMCWNQIFGTDSQGCHWKKFVSASDIPRHSKLKPFSVENIIEHLKIDEASWSGYHRSMVEFRNDRLAHFHTFNLYPNPPSIEWALASACAYRGWLCELIKAKEFTGLPVQLSSISEEQMLLQFQSEIENVCT